MLEIIISSSINAGVIIVAVVASCYYYCSVFFSVLFIDHSLVMQSNKRVWNAVLGCNLKMDGEISVHFKGKPLNVTVIQVYAPTTDAKELKSTISMKTYNTF